MKKLIITVVVTIATLTFTSLILKPEENQMAYHNPQVSVLGQPKSEITFDNVIKDMSTHAILGIPDSITSVNENYDRVIFNLEEVFYGQQIEESIILSTQKGLLNQGQSYILFVSEFDSPLYDELFYVVFPEYVIQVEESGDIGVIQNPQEGILIKPFVKEKYNNLDYITTRLNQLNTKMFKMFPSPDKPKTLTGDVKDLIDQSDTIIKINVKGKQTLENALDVDGIVFVDFDLVDQIKGRPLENVYRLLLREPLVVEDYYYVFLMRTQDGSLLPLSRNGAVVNVDDASEKLISELSKLK